MKQYVISVLVSNHLGIIARVASLFFHHGFSIDSMAVSETKQIGMSRITVSMSGDDYARDQMVKQLGKLHDVKAIEEMYDENTLSRELLLLKVKSDTNTVDSIINISNAYSAKIIDDSDDMICMELTGTSVLIDSFVSEMGNFTVAEMCRTGVIALEKGKNCLAQGKK